MPLADRTTSRSTAGTTSGTTSGSTARVTSPSAPGVTSPSAPTSTRSGSLLTCVPLLRGCDVSSTCCACGETATTLGIGCELRGECYDTPRPAHRGTAAALPDGCVDGGRVGSGGRQADREDRP